MDLSALLGDEADDLLNHQCKGVPGDDLVLPGPDFVERVLSWSDRPVPVQRSLQKLFDTGRLGGTGYLSILPVDQGLEQLSGSKLRQEPRLLRSEEPLRVGH